MGELSFIPDGPDGARGAPTVLAPIRSAAILGASKYGSMHTTSSPGSTSAITAEKMALVAPPTTHTSLCASSARPSSAE